MPDKTLNQKREEVSIYIKRKMLEMSIERGEIIDQVRLSFFLGVPQPTISSWISRGRIPTRKYLNIIADKFEEFDIYDAVGERVHLPEDPDLRLVVEKWMEMSEQDRENLVQIVENMARQQRENKDARARANGESAEQS